MSRIVLQLTFTLFMCAVISTAALADEYRLRGTTIHREMNLSRQNLDQRPPVDPVFRAVDFFKLAEAGDLRERIERLTYGTHVDIPPQYDYYGYSIRRYMARVGSPAALSTKENIKGQITNIEYAEMVLQQWKLAIYKEIDVIDDIRRDDPKRAASVGSLYKYNTSSVKAFLLEAQSWLKNNKAFLRFLYNLNEESYEYKDPVFIFTDARDLERFNAFYDAQQKSLKQIQTYPPFRMMLY